MPPAWRGAARSSLACLESILYANLTGGRPGLSDGKSFHLLRPLASLNPIEMTMEQHAYSPPTLIRGIIQSRPPFPPPHIIAKS